MEDLMNNTPNKTVVNDLVSGFTIAQIFSAYQTDVTTIPQYKARFLLQNNNAQLTVPYNKIAYKIFFSGTRNYYSFISCRPVFVCFS